MENSEKIKLFEKELVYILNPKIREFAEKALEDVPDQFFHASAPSTFKYHPAYSLGDGGLLRHTRAAVRIVVELFRMEEYAFPSDEKDLIIVALILHDSRKYGMTFSGNFSVHEHPVLATEAIKNNPELQNILPSEWLKETEGLISSHMGQWVSNKYSKVVLPKPATKAEKLMHLADYLASRRCLTMEFDVEVNRD